MFTMPFDLRWGLGWIWIMVAAIRVAAAFGTKWAVKRQSSKTRVVEAFCMWAAFVLLFNPNPWPGILRRRIVPDEPLAAVTLFAANLLLTFCRPHVWR
jgi:hypothetical protein